MGSANRPGYFRTFGCWLIVPQFAAFFYAMVFASAAPWTHRARLLAIVAAVGLLMHIPMYLLHRRWQRSLATRNGKSKQDGNEQGESHAPSDPPSGSESERPEGRSDETMKR